MDAAEVLREAAQHVEKGWCRGDLDGGFGKVCALGGINKAIWGDAEAFSSLEASPYRSAIQVLSQVMAEQYDVSFWAPESDEDVITRVNDTRVKSRKEIVACMEKAAARLEEAT